MAFIVKEGGQSYRVTVRGSYLKVIRSERKLRQVLRDAIIRTYGVEAADRMSIFRQDEVICIIDTKVNLKEGR